MSGCPGCLPNAMEMERRIAAITEEVKALAVQTQTNYAIWQEAGQWMYAPADTIEGHRPGLRFISKYNG